MLRWLFSCCASAIAPIADPPKKIEAQEGAGGPGAPPHAAAQLTAPEEVTLECPESKWDKIGASRLKKALFDTVMIDAGWLADLADSGGVLPRCQEVPASARVSLAEMEAWQDDYTVGVLVISYPWLERSHPDPHGEQLRKIAFVLKIFAAAARNYSSLPQKNLDGIDDRTDEQKARFGRVLKGGINVLYGHQMTHVLLVTTPLPTGHAYFNTQPYGGRGWCFAESVMSAMVKDDGALFDLAKLHGDESSVGDLVENGKSDRRPPVAPDAFHEMLRTGVDNETIKFTNKGDVEVVASIYKRAFIDEMSAAEALYYPGLGWGDAQIATLAAALAYAHAMGALAQLRELRLYSNKIGDVGLSALADAAAKGALAKLERLFLSGNTIGDAGMVKFSEALGKGALAQCTSIVLSGNQIGDIGLSALADAAAKGVLAPGATILLGPGNKATDAGRQTMREAATARGFQVHF